jgi:competence/damage-inducible protein CinA-like protein
MPSAEIIAIGTELLLGETVDTNTHHIARALRGLGVDLFHTQTVGDNLERIAHAVRQAMQRAQIVITTGGLGPTVDDPTRQAVAQACGVGLEFHPGLWEQIEARIQRYGRSPTENQKRQAFIPVGAVAIPNPVGTAPAFYFDSGACVVITLPGVPGEMQTLLSDAVLPYLRERFAIASCIQVRTLHAAGVGEAWLDEQIGDLETLSNPTVGLAAHSGIVSIRIAAKAASQAEAQQAIARVEETLHARLGVNLFGVDEETLEGVLLSALARRGWSLTCLDATPDGALLDRLQRAGKPAYRTGATQPSSPAELGAHTAAQRQAARTSAAIGLLVEEKSDKSDIHYCLITPSGTQDRHLTYGGHPRNAVRWGANLALDGLRRLLLETAAA